MTKIHEHHYVPRGQTRACEWCGQAEPKVHPHIAATGGADSVTHYVCSARPYTEQTHHLRPRARTDHTELVCEYCHKSEAQLREEVGL